MLMPLPSILGMEKDKEGCREIVRGTERKGDGEEYVKCWGLGDRSEGKEGCIYIKKKEGRKWEAERFHSDSLQRQGKGTFFHSEAACALWGHALCTSHGGG